MGVATAAACASRPISISRPVPGAVTARSAKRRAWNASVKPQDFRLIAGKDELGDYQFNTKQGHHRFCRTCGIAPFGDGDVKEIGGAFVSISVACLDDVTPEQLAKLPIKYMDGRHDNWFEQPKVTSYL
jgi:hypothetical protein